MNLSETDKAYIAGIIDGEGCIYIDNWKDTRGRPNRCYIIRVKVAMTDREVPEWLSSVVGGSCRNYDCRKKNNNHKIIYIWSYCGTKTIDFLKIIKPYLKIKHKQAEVAIEFRKTLFDNHERGRSGHFLAISKTIIKIKEKLHKQMKSLNQREVPESGMAKG